MSKITYLLFILFLLVSISSCSDSDDKDTYDLTFEKSDYTVMNGYSTYIMIRSGNGDYTVTPGDKDMLEVNYLLPTVGMGDIQIRGKKKGKTTLTVRDNVANQEVKLNITVTEAYMNLGISAIVPSVKISDAEDKTKIEKEIADNALFKAEYIFSLVKDGAKTMYLFKSKEDLSKGNYLHKGTYSFEEISNLPYLVLNYTENGSPKTKTYLLSDSSSISILSAFFELGWHKSKSISQYYSLILTEDFTAYYKTTYPDLTEATLKTHSYITSLNGGVELPVELVK